MSWADTDNDGDLDLLVPSVFDVNTFEYRTRLVRNDGADGAGGWVFNETSPGIDGAAHAQSAWADDDKDGDLDLFMVNVGRAGGCVICLRAPTPGACAPQTAPSTTALATGGHRCPFW